MPTCPVEGHDDSCVVFFAPFRLLPCIAFALLLPACVGMDLPDASEWREARDHPAAAGIALSDHTTISFAYLPSEQRYDDDVVAVAHVVQRGATEAETSSQLLFALRKVEGGYVGEKPLFETEEGGSLNLSAGYNSDHAASAGLYWRLRF